MLVKHTVFVTGREPDYRFRLQMRSIRGRVTVDWFTRARTPGYLAAKKEYLRFACKCWVDIQNPPFHEFNKKFTIYELRTTTNELPYNTTIYQGEQKPMTIPGPFACRTLI